VNRLTVWWQGKATLIHLVLAKRLWRVEGFLFKPNVIMPTENKGRKSITKIK
jgi:hypothetical protein